MGSHMIDPSIEHSSSSEDGVESTKGDQLTEAKVTKKTPLVKLDLKAIAATGRESAALMASLILSDKDFDDLMDEKLESVERVEEKEQKKIEAEEGEKDKFIVDISDKAEQPKPIVPAVENAAPATLAVKKPVEEAASKHQQ
ncbi:hypothetical protein ACLOJK_018918 [Asimina triloba]